MPTESAFLLAGLLVIAAALGYVFARFGDFDQDEPQRRLNADYLKGLNYLLNEDSDRAVEVFTRMTAVDDDTVETHFALGSLFRRRGEVDRAIRVHQNLMARPTLKPTQKSQAKLALAEDYLSAGLFDRAEDLYKELCQSNELRKQALARLIQIYEVTRDWENAIETSSDLERSDPSSANATRTAHYFCELADRARAGKDFSLARDMLKKADSARRGSVRSVLARADLAQDTGEFKEAIKLYRKVAKDSPDLLSEVIPKLAASCRAAERNNELTAFLRDVRKRDPRSLHAIALATVVDPAIDDEFALAALRDFVHQDVTLHELVDADGLDGFSEPQRTERLGQVRAALRRVIDAGSRYRCRECGYACLALQWQCPSCRRWETVKPETQIGLSAEV
jgi:lipopolysaccharide biosynthesis regulator YciM